MSAIALALSARAVRLPAWTSTAVALTVLVLLELAALRGSYVLRVTSDTPTFLALMRDLAADPFARTSPYLASETVASPHATPYTQALALAWRAIAPASIAADPVAVGRFLALAGLWVTAGLAAAVVAWSRSIAGRAAAWAVVPVLLVLFGPAHIVWASDLTFHGFLYAAFYPQNVALALMLATLLVLERTSRRSLVAAAALSCATLLVHPLTGLLLIGLATARAGGSVIAGARGAWRGPIAVSVGFAAGLAWPAYSLNAMFGETGVPGWLIVAAAVGAVAAIHRGRTVAAAVAQATVGRTHRVAALVTGARAELVLAAAGAAIVAGLVAWQLVLMASPPPDPLLTANRLSLYWGEDRWRWPLMFAAGATGLAGLVRLAMAGRGLALVWFAGCFGLGVLGAVGLPLPLWWRFLLLAQVPLALGVAVVLHRPRSRAARWIVIATLLVSATVKLGTLLWSSERITYWGTPVQDAYRLGEVIPPGDGLIASDPFTSYYLPAATGHRVLTVTKAHVGSTPALRASERGYDLLHRFVMGSPRGYWAAAEEMWDAGVRYVVVEKWTALDAPDLETFSTGPTPIVRTERQAAIMSRQAARLRRVGRVLADTEQHAVYVLDGRRLGRGRR